jgi:prolyl-tRNA editing enzyme YbaK/EbsC (Cys-tRNA(Pro) deacylase)
MRTSVDVHNFLVERDTPHEVFSARGRLRSAERIAAVLDLPPEEVGKVEILEGSQGAVAAVVPSDHRSDPKKVARAVGWAAVDLVADDRASEITGFLAEAIPPVGLPNDIPIVVDRSLDRDAVLYFSGGEVRSVLKIRGTDLVRVTGAKVAAIHGPRPPARSARSARSTGR